ncbi:DUF3349 domain-containing protein [Mycolicibacterium sp. 120320]|uniref:DUF3349 domain-containing protein n=1 Tax=unclassified Mycolicibacterium TaxID=2636767 RepID=UPI003FA61333
MRLPATPTVVPATDYVPLLASLHCQLSDIEVRQAAGELIATRQWPVAVTDVEVAIAKVVDTYLPRRTCNCSPTAYAMGWPTTGTL